MGVAPGSIRSIVTSMCIQGLLQETKSNARGKALKLTPVGRAELRKHESTGGIGAILPTGERLVFVIDEGRGMPADLLAELAADPAFRWAARIDGPVKWIASFGSGDAAAADRAATTLVGAGARAVVGRADMFLDSSELVAYAAKLGRASHALNPS
jgi:hypothetical protein